MSVWGSHLIGELSVQRSRVGCAAGFLTAGSAGGGGIREPGRKGGPRALGPLNIFVGTWVFPFGDLGSPGRFRTTQSDLCS